jgi:GNAT superfamily N-acetyltransferase
MKNHINIRQMLEEDCVAISEAFAGQGWNKPVTQYQNYLRQSTEGKRDILVAEVQGHFAGYVTIEWESGYPPFQEAHIPEIVDLNVLTRYQRQGVGSALLAEAEQRIAQRSPIIGIGVGLTADYGVAQSLYPKRGYVPDGRGIYNRGKPVEHGEVITINDDVALYLIKRLE